MRSPYLHTNPFGATKHFCCSQQFDWESSWPDWRVCCECKNKSSLQSYNTAAKNMDFAEYSACWRWIVTDSSCRFVAWVPSQLLLSITGTCLPVFVSLLISLAKVFYSGSFNLYIILLMPHQLGLPCFSWTQTLYILFCLIYNLLTVVEVEK